MNYNSIVTFIYEVCTSTYIIEIRGTPDPLVQLLQGLQLDKPNERKRHDQGQSNQPVSDVPQTKHGNNDAEQTV